MKEELPNGHETIVTEHFDGSKDVQINIKRLDLGKERTEEDIIAEDVILSNLQKIQVGVVVLCKATGDNTYFVCPLTEVRVHAEQVVNNYLHQINYGLEPTQAKKRIQLKDFCKALDVTKDKSFVIIEVAVGERPPKVSTL